MYIYQCKYMEEKKRKSGNKNRNKKVKVGQYISVRRVGNKGGGVCM